MTKIRRILVTGSREWPAQYRPMVGLALTHELAIANRNEQQLVIVHGHCPTGVDMFADKWAYTQKSLGVTAERHPAQWDLHGKSAGFKRNTYMASLGADRCLAFIHGGSRGATHCAKEAASAGIKVIRFAIDLIELA